LRRARFCAINKYMDAKNTADTAAAASPGELVELARALYLAHRYEEALEAAQRLLAYAARGYSVRALCLSEMGKPAEGLQAAEAAVATDPSDAVALTSRGFCRHRLGDNAGAEADYRRALELDPDNYKVPYNYACYWAERHDVDRCRELLEKAVALMPPGIPLNMMEDADLARYHREDWFRDLALRARAAINRKP